MATVLPGAEGSGREGEDMEQVEGFGNGQADATIAVILRVSEHAMMEGAIPQDAERCFLHEWPCGPVPIILICWST